MASCQVLDGDLFIIINENGKENIIACYELNDDAILELQNLIENGESREPLKFVSPSLSFRPRMYMEIRLNGKREMSISELNFHEGFSNYYIPISLLPKYIDLLESIMSGSYPKTKSYYDVNISELIIESKSGSPEAQYFYARCLEYGIGTQRDLATAIDFYHRSAAQGNAKAQHRLGECYRLGFGVEQSDNLSFQYFQRAAKQGHVGAMFKLGMCYFYGYGVTESKPDAIKWWLKATKSGHPEAKMTIEDLSMNYNKRSL